MKIHKSFLSALDNEKLAREIKDFVYTKVFGEIESGFRLVDGEHLAKSLQQFYDITKVKPRKDLLKKVYEGFLDREDVSSIATLLNIFQNSEEKSCSIDFQNASIEPLYLGVPDAMISKRYQEILDEISLGNLSLYVSEDNESNLEKNIKYIDFLQKIFRGQNVHSIAGYGRGPNQEYEDPALANSVQNAYKGLITRIIYTQRIGTGGYWTEDCEHGLEYALKLQDIVMLRFSPEVVKAGYEFMLCENNHLDSAKKLKEHTGIPPDKQIIKAHLDGLLE